MPGLVHRFSTITEYSAFMSTNRPISMTHSWHYDCDLPGGAPAPHSSPRRSKPRLIVLKHEVDEWANAMCPPLEDMQTVLRRMRADPEMTQARVMARLGPLVSFGALFAIMVVSVKPQSFVQRIFESENVWAEISRFAMLVLCGIMFIMAALKATICAFAELCNHVESIETKKGERGRTGTI